MSHVGRTWRLPSRSVGFPGSPDPDFGLRLALADIARIGATDWTDVARHPAVAALAEAIDGGRCPGPGEARAALDGLASSLPHAVAVRDHATERRSTRTATVVQCGSGTSLLDVSLAVAGTKAVLRAEATGIGWTRHAMARRYERSRAPGNAATAFGASLARSRDLLRLACRVAAAAGLTEVPVPAGDGMLFGSLSPPAWFEPPVSGCMVFRPGDVHVGQVAPTGPAADGNHWTGITYVPREWLYLGHLWRMNLWGLMAARPEVGALAGLPDWAGGELADRLVAEAMGAVGDDMGRYLQAIDAAPPGDGSGPGGWPEA